VQHTTTRAAAVAAVATFGLVGGFALPAAGAGKSAQAPGAAVAAEHAAMRSQGDGQEPTWTEDNDTNDGGTPNNVPDEGDNQHPSGKDRSVEPGGSGNQGRSPSDPDDDGRGPDRSNGGPDKPNGSGGVDLADQDGNNGCGNDDDFEDDNEGWCGRNPKRANVTPPPAPEATDGDDDDTGGGSVGGSTLLLADDGEEEAPAEVLGTTTVIPFGAPAVLRAATGTEGEVLSAMAVAPTVSARSTGAVAAATVVPAGTLPRTGGDPGSLLVVAIALVAAGGGLTATTRRQARS
jgi:LPXTG-motif cell wall-anchored protein